MSMVFAYHAGPRAGRPSARVIAFYAEPPDRVVELALGWLAPEVHSQVTANVVATHFLVGGLASTLAQLSDETLTGPIAARARRPS